MTRLLMPKATSVWLVDNTTLTFEQIAQFTGLHALEIQAIADGEIGTNIQPYNPINNGIISQAELERCQKDPSATLQTLELDIPVLKRNRSSRYIPITKRSAKPNAIAWLVKHHPTMKDKQIIQLLGTTKGTIDKIKNDPYYRNTKASKPQSPVELGLCAKHILDEIVSNLPQEDT